MTEIDGQSQRTAWQEPQFRRLLLGQGTSLVGDQVWLVVLVWLAAEHASPGIAGLVVGASSVPRALLLLFTGTYIDRHDPVRVAVACDVARAGIFVGAALISTLVGSAGTILLLTSVGITVGIGDAFFFPASAALRPRLLQISQLTSGTASYELTSRTAMLIGPPLGGLLMGAPLWAVFLINAASFGFSASCMAHLEARSKPYMTNRRPTVAMTLDGLRYLWRESELRTLVFALLVFNVAIAGAINLGGVLVAREQRLGPMAVSVLFVSFAAGAIGAALVLGRASQRSAPLATIGLAAIVQSLTIVGIGYSATTVFLGGFGFWAGGSSSVLGITASSHVQAMTEDSFRGRVNSVTALANYGLVPISLGLTGVMAGTWGVTRAMTVLAVMEAVAAVVCYLAGRTFLPPNAKTR